MKSVIRSWALIGLIAGILAGSAAAQIQTFAKFGDVKGGSTDVNHKDWIDVLSLRQPYAIEAMNLQKTTAVGRSAMPKEPCTIEIVKGLDIAGPQLWGDMMKGTHFKDITIDVTIPVAESQKLLYQIVMGEALITSIVTTGGPRVTVGDMSPGMGFVETVTVQANQVQLTFYSIDPNGTMGGSVAAKFDCAIM